MNFSSKKEAPNGQKELWLDCLNIDTEDWSHVFSACLGKMMAIQTACGEQVVKGQNWNVDFSEGTICFGEQKYPIQFIGSEAAARIHGCGAGKISMAFPKKCFN